MMTDNDIIPIDIKKYAEALNNLIGMDSAYFNRDKDVGAIVEIITIAKKMESINNCQKAEIEAYKHYYNECLKDLKNAHAEIERLDELVIEKHTEINRLDKYIQYTKAEAIREFMERLKDAYPEGNRDAKCPAIYYDDYCYIIDELAEKLMGEESI